MKHPYPLFECNRTKAVKPGYAVCEHVFNDEPIVEVVPPLLNHAGLILCAACAMQGSEIEGNLLLCCHTCTPEKLLIGFAA